MGVDRGRVSPERDSWESLLNWLRKTSPAGRYHVQAFYNWDRCYGKADIDKIVEVTAADVAAQKVR